VHQVGHHSSVASSTTAAVRGWTTCSMLEPPSPRCSRWSGHESGATSARDRRGLGAKRTAAGLLVVPPAPVMLDASLGRRGDGRTAMTDPTARPPGTGVGVHLDKSRGPIRLQWHHVDGRSL
jgi:hypothetical protein